VLLILSKRSAARAGPQWSTRGFRYDKKLEIARRAVDFSKFGSITMVRVCGLDEPAGVITNGDPGKDCVKTISKGRAELFLM
jgi:Transcriptional regulators of sugar metabolism